MALKSTIYKTALQVSDIDRGVYGEHALTLALHPSETEERLMVRLLAFALQVPSDDRRGTLQFARGLSDTDEPDLWQRDLSDQLVHWIEVGQPDERRLARACGRAEQVTIYAYGPSASIWWSALQAKVARLRNLAVWLIDSRQSRDLAQLAQRSMQLQATVQDGHVWIGHAQGSTEVVPQALQQPGGPAR